jgi:hypothetical protein
LKKEAKTLIHLVPGRHAGQSWISRLSGYGDKRDLLGIKVYQGTRIISVRGFITMRRRLP